MAIGNETNQNPTASTPSRSANPRMGNPLNGRRSHSLFRYVLSGQWIGLIADNAILFCLFCFAFGLSVTVIFGAESRSGLAGAGSKVGRFLAPVIHDNVNGIVEPVNGGAGLYPVESKANAPGRTVEIKPGSAKE